MVQSHRAVLEKSYELYPNLAKSGEPGEGEVR